MRSFRRSSIAGRGYEGAAQAAPYGQAGVRLCGFTGGYTIIKDYMRERDQRRQEVFVPLSHPPGHAQADFGEATVVIGGVEQKARFFVLDLPRSDGCYVQAYPAAVAEAWLDGHIHAFAFFGAVPQSIVYDNDRCLVAKILPHGTRKRAALFSGFLSHDLIRDRYGRPGKALNASHVGNYGIGAIKLRGRSRRDPRHSPCRCLQPLELLRKRCLKARWVPESFVRVSVGNGMPSANLRSPVTYWFMSVAIWRWCSSAGRVVAAQALRAALSPSSP